MGENNILKLMEYYMLLFMYVLKSTVLQPFVEWIDTRIEMNPTLVHSLDKVNAGMVHVNESDDDYANSEVDMRDDYLQENVDDMRESPTFDLMDELADLGAEVSYHDPHIPEIIPTREHARWRGARSVEWAPETIAAFDCVLIATNHQVFNLPELLESADLVVDTRNAIAKAGLVPREGQVVKA